MKIGGKMSSALIPKHNNNVLKASSYIYTNNITIITIQYDVT